MAALLAVARRCGVADTADAGLIEVPASTNARGLREVGCLPNLGPGLVDASPAGLSAPEIPEAKPAALLLVQADPVRTHPDPRPGSARSTPPPA